jgi:hypothetical protein
VIAITKGAAAADYEYSLNSGTDWTSASAGTLGDEGATLTITLASSDKNAYAAGTIKARLKDDSTEENWVASTGDIEAATTDTVTAEKPTSISVDSSTRKVTIGITEGAEAKAYEYSLNSGSTWTSASAGTVEGSKLTITIPGNTAYATGVIRARLANDDTKYVSTGTALTADLAGRVALSVTRSGEAVTDGTVKAGDVITATVTGAQSDAALRYAFTGKTAGTASATNTYTVTKDDVDNNISVKVTASNSDLYTGSITASTTAKVTSADDSNTDSTTPSKETTTETNAAGKEVTTTTTTKTDADGNVTSVTEKSVIAEVAKNTSASVTVKKDGEGEVTSATAAVTKTVGDTNKVSISGAVVDQLTEAAGTDDVKVTVTVKDADGKTKYKVKADADELTAGNDLYIYKLDTKTGEYVMVNAKTYKVSASGSVSVSMTEKATYELVTAKEAKAIEKKILKTVKVKKSSASVKKGKTTTVALASGVNKNNIKSITYTTSKKSVATVSKTGKITTKSKGTVTVKAKVTLKNGSTKTVKMTVKVK